MFRIQVVLARRHARIWFGGVLLLGAVVLYLTAAVVSPETILGGSWLAAAIAYGLARRVHPRAIDPAKLAAASVALPAIGVLAILPLTLHRLIAATGDSAGFEWWVMASLAFTTVTTLVTSILITLRARRLAKGTPMGRALSPWGIYGFGVLAACVPGIVFVLPVLIIAVTGLAIVPFLEAMETVLRRDRALLEDLELPEALARFKEAA